MIYGIYKDGTEINRIVSGPEFVSKYCAVNGYTYELIPDPEPTPELTLEEQLVAAYREGVASA